MCTRRCEFKNTIVLRRVACCTRAMQRMHGPSCAFSRICKPPRAGTWASCKPLRRACTRDRSRQPARAACAQQLQPTEMDAMLGCPRAGGLFLQPPRPSPQQHMAAAAAGRPRLAAARAWAQAARQPVERREGSAPPGRRGNGGGRGGRGGRGGNGSTPRGPVRQAGVGKTDNDILRLNKVWPAAGRQAAAHRARAARCRRRLRRRGWRRGAARMT